MGAWGEERHCLWLLRVPVQLQGSGRWQLNGATAVAGVQCSFPRSCWGTDSQAGLPPSSCMHGSFINAVRTPCHKCQVVYSSHLLMKALGYALTLATPEGFASSQGLWTLAAQHMATLEVSSPVAQLWWAS